MKIEINGVNYYLKVVGKGEPLLLLHGFTGAIGNWQPFEQEWGISHQLLIPDILGHGQSDSPKDWSRYQIEQVACDLKTILDTLQLNKVNLLGYSMGGRLALTFAIKYPERVKALILESSSPGLAVTHERETRIDKDQALADFIEQKGIEAFVQFWEAIPLFQSQQTLALATKEHIRRLRLQNNPLGLANSLRGMGTGQQPSWWNDLGQIKQPILLITGKKDQKFCSIGQKMQEKLPQAEYIEVKDAGHTVHLEQPELFSHLVLDFLNKVTN